MTQVVANTGLMGIPVSPCKHRTWGRDQIVEKRSPFLLSKKACFRQHLNPVFTRTYSDTPFDIRCRFDL